MSTNPSTLRGLLAFVLVVGPGSLGATWAQDRPPETPVPKADPLIERLVEGHNAERAREGLPPLRLDPKLCDAALVQAKDMATRDKMGHEGSDGSTPDERVRRAGYHYLRTGENVAVGYRDVPEVMRGWMDSPPHRKNIMGDFTEIGVARALGPGDKPYWSAEFGTPMPRLDPIEAGKDLLKRINDERAAVKLAPLVIDDRLAKAAQERAATQARNKGGVATFEGIDPKPYADMAMSLANGHPDAPAMAKVLMEKDDLKAQVLGKFSKVGIGYATAEDGIPFWCLILASPARK